MSDRDRGSDPLNRLRQIELELPERGTGARAARRRTPIEAEGASPVEPVADRASPDHGQDRVGPSRRWMTVFSGLLLLAVVGGAALTYVGVETVRNSTDGRTLATTDPTEPGFEGFLEPTPTLLVVHESDGSLRSLALLALGSQDTGGSVLLIPPSTRIESDDFSGPLSVAYAFGGGVEAMFHHVEAVLGIGITERVVVDDDRWRALMAGVAPVTVDNPDEVEGFETGRIELEADQVATWISVRGEQESDLSRMYRIERLWESWLSAVEAANDPAAVPGEIDSGIGRFVRGLSAGRREIATLPVLEEIAPDGGNPTYRVDPDPAAELVARMIPFPRGNVEGVRTRVRLLDGTGQPDHALSAAPLIVPAGAEIVIVGNAEAFEQPRETEVRYHVDAQQAAAERLQEAMGVGRVVDDARQVDSFDVTIILGTDI